MKTEHHQTLKGLFEQYGFENIISFLIARASEKQYEAMENGEFEKEKKFKRLVNALSDVNLEFVIEEVE